MSLQEGATRTLPALAALVGLWLGPGLARAQDTEGEGSQDSGAVQGEASAAAYRGVTLSGGDPPEFKAPSPGFQLVTWPGFALTEAGSEVFLQLTGPVAYSQKTRGLRVQVILDKVEVAHKNSLRPVITRHFTGTPVERFQLRRLKKGQMMLQVQLRRRVQAAITSRTVGKYTYLVLSFPPARRSP